ncbi:hypothetical protein [Bosea vaviloviae]|uniref:Uncharacterized protein n=1 Tax=Bosea vaviloviae TaxID=1526658 RepID=A0A0N0MC65_9HYPH|nr:hypothetical protein [Bosea vaviloviae]KPH80717.1 hypothetical protein AE618_13370 [Bosea vaviloviae]
MTIERLFLAGLLALPVGSLATTLPAAAQGAKPPTQVTIKNMRSVPLTLFEIATGGDQPRLVGKIAKPLPPGKSIAVKLNKPAGCSYFVLARFDDAVESDAEGMDLCKDRVIRLTE